MQSGLDILGAYKLLGKQTNTDRTTIQSVCPQVLMECLQCAMCPSRGQGHLDEQNRPVLCFLGNYILLRETW